MIRPSYTIPAYPLPSPEDQAPGAGLPGALELSTPPAMTAPATAGTWIRLTLPSGEILDVDALDLARALGAVPPLRVSASSPADDPDALDGAQLVRLALAQPGRPANTCGSCLDPNECRAAGGCTLDALEAALDHIEDEVDRMLDPDTIDTAEPVRSVFDGWGLAPTPPAAGGWGMLAEVEGYDPTPAPGDVLQPATSTPAPDPVGLLLDVEDDDQEAPFMVCVACPYPGGCILNARCWLDDQADGLDADDDDDTADLPDDDDDTADLPGAAVSVPSPPPAAAKRRPRTIPARFRAPRGEE